MSNQPETKTYTLTLTLPNTGRWEDILNEYRNTPEASCKIGETQYTKPNRYLPDGTIKAKVTSPNPAKTQLPIIQSEFMQINHQLELLAPMPELERNTDWMEVYKELTSTLPFRLPNNQNQNTFQPFPKVRG